MSRVEGVLNWYTENDKNDPNMYELVEVLSQYSRNADESEEKVEDLVKLELTRLITNGIIKDTNDSLINMVMEFAEKALNGYAVPQELEDYAKKVAGVSFWLKTEYSRGATFEYDNTDEYKQMLRLEDEVKKNGINISDSIKILMDYINVHSSDMLKRVKNNHLNDYVGEVTNDLLHEADDNKFAEMLMMAEPYVYPEKMKKMLEDAKANYLLPLDVAIDIIINLGQGMDLNSVKNKLRDTNLSGVGEAAVLGFVLKYAKQGPDFYVFMYESDGVKVSEENMKFLENIKQENRKLEEQHGGKTDSSNYSI